MDFESNHSLNIVDLFTDIKLYCENNGLDILNKKEVDMNYYFYKLIFKHVELKEMTKEEKENENDDFFE